MVKSTLQDAPQEILEEDPDPPRTGSWRRCSIGMGGLTPTSSGSSARIGAGTAMQAAQALSDQGWTTAKKMTAATWAERTRTLNQAGYARYDESTSRMLAQDFEEVLAAASR